MVEELESLRENNVWELVDRPKGKNIVTCKWVLRIKRNPDGSINRYKARLVARGFSQVYGIDYDDTFSPVASAPIIRALFAFAASKKLSVAGFDVKTAFLYGNLEETIYMEQPDGWKQDDRVCKLQRSLYGLKQAPRCWNQRFTNFLTNNNLKAAADDPCLFYNRDRSIYLAIYVDDGLVLAKNQLEIDNLFITLEAEFKIHRVNLTSYLGFEIQHRANDIILHQTNYVRRLISKFGLSNANSVSTPMTNDYIDGEDDHTPAPVDVPFKQIIGSLLYASVTTRIDITQAVARISRKMDKPMMKDWVALKRMIRYLIDKEHYGIQYKSHKENFGLTVYCDADFASNSDGHSTSGYVILLNNQPILWRSKTQHILSLSPAEAELDSICTCTKTVAWLRRVLLEVGIISDVPVKIWSDCMSALNIIENEKIRQRTRHMTIRAAYPREEEKRGHIKLGYVRGEDQLADALTKPLPRNKFNLFLPSLVFMSMMMLFTNNSSTDASQLTKSYSLDNGNFILLRKDVRRIYGQGVHFRVGVVMRNRCHSYDTNSVSKEARAKCFHLFSREVGDRINELSATVDSLAHSRALGLIGLIPTLKLIYTIISNAYIAYTILFNGHDKTYNNYHDIDSIRRMKEIYQPKNMAIKQLTKSVDLLNQDVESVRKRMVGSSDIAYTYVLTINSIYHIGMKLDALIDSARKGLVDTKALCSLMRMHIDGIEHEMCEECHQRICNIDLEDTSFKKVSIFTTPEDQTKAMYNYEKGVYSEVVWSDTDVELEFTGVIQDNTSYVYEVLAFDHWVESVDKLQFVRHVGPKFVLYNRTTNCMQSIIDDRSKLIFQQCLQRDHKDPKISKWSVDVDREFSQQTVVKQVNGFSYIYCYPGFITINNQYEKCPNDLIKIIMTQGFNTSDIVVMGGTDITMNLTIGDVIVEQVSFGNDTNYEIIHHLLDDTKQALNTERSSKMWYQISTYFLSFFNLILATYFGYRIIMLKLRTTNENQQKVMQRMDIAMDNLRCSRHAHQAHGGVLENEPGGLSG